MVFNPARPEIATVTSEALQAKIRELLPSQDGFGADLAAQNVIVPTIDLTAAAEGSSTGENLQTALAFGSQTAFDVNNTTTAIINTAGFYRIFGSCTIQEDSSAPSANISATDGSTTKIFIKWQQASSGSTRTLMNSFDFIVFADTGITYNVFSSGTPVFIAGSVRQIADSTGTLVMPSGFTPQ